MPTPNAISVERRIPSKFFESEIDDPLSLDPWYVARIEAEKEKAAKEEREREAKRTAELEGEDQRSREAARLGFVVEPSAPEGEAADAHEEGEDEED